MTHPRSCSSERQRTGSDSGMSDSPLLVSPLWFLSQCISISLFISPSLRWALALIAVGHGCWERGDATVPAAPTEHSPCGQICACEQPPTPGPSWSPRRAGRRVPDGRAGLWADAG